MPMPMFSDESCDEYWEFKRTFQRHIREAPIPDAVKLERLISAYYGHAKKAPPRLPACRRPGDRNTGYKRPLALLEELCGDEDTYIKELIDKILSGPTVKHNVIKGLHELAESQSQIEHLVDTRAEDTDQVICSRANRPVCTLGVQLSREP